MTGDDMTLPTRPLGTSGLEITTAGLGTWAIGGGGWLYGWGPQDDDQSLATMRRAVERGITWFDTAGVYGHGHSEEVCGRFLREVSDDVRPLVFTKCGPVWDERTPFKDEPSDLSPGNIRRQCEDSLRRLGVERLDLLQFHWPDDAGVAIEESWAEMARLVDEGKVRAAGVSNFDPGLLARCEAIRHVDSLQQEFSLIERETAAGELPWVREHGTGLLCYSPMGAGQLTDGFTAERLRELSDEDWRRREFLEPALSRNLALRDALRPIAARHETSVMSVALAWLLAWDGVTATIVGARRPEQIDGWIGGAALRLTADDLDEIAGAVRATHAGEGPDRP
jgi:aryl-alcohol dehydrogenase-like predicted oxidoreductase